ncbi:hypothetical protein OC846_000422 [Tilletia horrida]|uniref:Uncharacterized protein n=1 Tax=Tilletia horrida TaxID=155126 RepID=A0AAN6K0U8_9BASI|nr:hypothetical protein OC845_001064 [Tilletia horrida]KAK0557434.1 hypothetical protein OC846_000422 [Tilletia horrida]KAK0569538.1 hypothetical protein OC861_000807 [Tilletia horrida]
MPSLRHTPPLLPAEVLRLIFIQAARNESVQLEHESLSQRSSSHSSSTSRSNLSLPIDSRWNDNITSLLLVSRVVQQWVLAELLHTVTLITPPQIFAFAGLLRAQPKLSRFIKRLWISNLDGASSDPQANSIQPIYAIENFILPNLTSLEDLVLTNLTSTHLRSQSPPLWGIGRARRPQEWSKLRTMTLANTRGLGAFLSSPNREDPSWCRTTPPFEHLETLRIALPEEFSAHRIKGIARIPRLRYLELIEPGLDTRLDVDGYTGSIVPGGIAKQTFGCIRGSHPDQHSIKLLYRALIRSLPTSFEPAYSHRQASQRSWEDEFGGVELRIWTRSQDAYTALQVAWNALNRRYASRCSGSSTPSSGSEENTHSHGSAPSSLPQHVSSTSRSCPSAFRRQLPRLRIAALDTAGHDNSTQSFLEKSASFCPDLGKSIYGETQLDDEDLFIAAPDAPKWKADLEDTLLLQWTGPLP